MKFQSSVLMVSLDPSIYICNILVFFSSYFPHVITRDPPLGWHKEIDPQNSIVRTGKANTVSMDLLMSQEEKKKLKVTLGLWT